MDEKTVPRPMHVIDSLEDRIEEREDFDKIHVTVTEKSADIENDFEEDEKPMQSEFLEVRAAADVGDD